MNKQYTDDFYLKNNKFNLLLEQIKKSSLNAREKGTKFEKVTRTWLLHDPVNKGVYTNVLPYTQWVKFCKEAQEYHLSNNDIGIDLVAITKENKNIAIQCKFPGKNTKIYKKEIDSFISSSSSPIFDE